MVAPIICLIMALQQLNQLTTFILLLNIANTFRLNADRQIKTVRCALRY